MDIQTNFCSNKIEFRSHHLLLLLHRYDSEDAHNKSSSTQCKVAIIFPLYLEGLRIIRSSSRPEWKNYRSLIAAAWATGYIFSLRPNEYISNDPFHNPDSHLLSSSTFFGWSINSNMVYFAVTNLRKAPPTPPCAFYSALPFSKGEQLGGGPAKAALVSDSPSPNEPIHVVWEHFNQWGVSEGVPLFYNPSFSITPEVLNKVTKELASIMRIDPARLVPHSLRMGVLNQAFDVDSETQQALGQWKHANSTLPYHIDDPALWAATKKVRNKAVDIDAIPTTVLLRHFNLN